MIRPFRAELHTHTVLSPCAQIEMIPPLIVREALAHNIDLLAVTDHNATANIVAVQNAARETSLKILPGMELQTREEVHVLCIFDSLDQVQILQAAVDRLLPPITNNTEFFGEQFVVDETGDFIRNEDRLLLSSVDLSLNDAWELVTGIGGLFIPAHVNRKAFGLLEILGFVPTDISVPALEISRHLSPVQAYEKFPQIKKYPLIQNGDVHGLDDFLASTTYYLEKPTVSELRLALQSKENRGFKIKTS